MTKKRFALPLIFTSLFGLALSACGTPADSGASVNASASASPQPSASSSAEPTQPLPTPSPTQFQLSSKDWTEAEITAYADCIDKLYPKDQMATTARVQLAGMQQQKDRMSGAVYRGQLNQIGSLLVGSEGQRGTLLQGKPTGCEKQVGH